MNSKQRAELAEKLSKQSADIQAKTLDSMHDLSEENRLAIRIQADAIALKRRQDAEGKKRALSTLSLDERIFLRAGFEASKMYSEQEIDNHIQDHALLRNMTPEQKMMLKTALESLGCYRSASYTPGESHASVEEDLETEVAGMVVKANRLRKQVEAKIKNRRGK